MRLRQILGLFIGIVFSMQASAAWIWLDDPDLTDDAVNPGPANSSPEGPANQNPDSIQDWLEDLTNQSVTYLTGDDDTPDVLSDLDSMGATYIVLHYGNYQGEVPDGFIMPTRQQGQRTVTDGNVNLAFFCDGLSSCDDFNPDNQGLSNYRIFGVDITTVPAPAAFVLLLGGFIGMTLHRRRRITA